MKSTYFQLNSIVHLDYDFDRSRLASISHNISKKKGREIDFTSASVRDTHTLVKTKQLSCSVCTQKGLLFYSNPNAEKAENRNPLETRESRSKVLTKSKQRTFRFMASRDSNFSSKSIQDYPPIQRS